MNYVCAHTVCAYGMLSHTYDLYIDIILHTHTHMHVYIYMCVCVYKLHDTFGKSTNIAGQCCLLHILVLPQTKEPCRVLQSLLVRTDAKMVLTSHWRRHKAKGFFEFLPYGMAISFALDMASGCGWSQK